VSSGAMHPVMTDRWCWIHTRQALNFVGGLAGGFVASTVGFPLDVLRIRLLFGTALQRNFFNGFLFTFPYTILKSGLVWPFQRNIKQLCEERVSGFGGTLLSGTIGNALPGVLLNPLNIIKVRLMESHDSKKVREVVREIIDTEGKEAFRRGLCATLTRDALWGMLYFPLFEFYQKKYSSQKDGGTYFNTTCLSVGHCSIHIYSVHICDRFCAFISNDFIVRTSQIEGCMENKSKAYKLEFSGNYVRR